MDEIHEEDGDQGKDNRSAVLYSATSNAGKHHQICGGRPLVLITIFFMILSICLTIALIIVLTTHEGESKNPLGRKYGLINLSLSNDPSVFAPLTVKEIRSVRIFLHGRAELNLVDMGNYNINESFIYMSDLYMPKKENVLDHLDNGGKQPDREAHVVVYRGNKNPPFIEEIVVGPLPNPTKYRPVEFRPKRIPMKYRVPYGAGELEEAFNFAVHEIDTHLGIMFQELFGGRLNNCTDKCLTFRHAIPLTPAFTGNIGDNRTIILTLFHKVEYVMQHPLYFTVFVKIEFRKFTIPLMHFYRQYFSSFDDIIAFYNVSKTSLPKIQYPDYSSDLFSVLTQRGIPPMDTPLQNPRQISPDGKRYNVKGRYVEYMFWKFHFRMDAVHGAQIYDVRFKDERIAYEIGMQEIAVLYSGDRPNDLFAHYLDSLSSIGTTSHFLFPGIDCPSDATFLPATFDIGNKEPVTTPSSFCLFEFNTGAPLRRHHSYRYIDGLFYEGMENVVLNLRTIHTVVNYDYIVDFLFYQTGALEVKVTSTGYVKSSFFTPHQKPYSFELNDNYAATIHQHLFHFKVDLDVKGMSNRFATLDIETEEISNPLSKGSATITQTKFSRSEKQTELDAAYNFNFEAPKYLIMYNEHEKDGYGNAKGYRIVNRGMTKQLLPKGSGNEPMVSWARYQVAITKHNNSERTSNSIYSTYDQENPVTNFQGYIDNDNSIVDEDLVAWITLGQYHIPHTEDLPITTSPAMDSSCFLLPYNYFKEDPAIASKNAVRVELTDRTDSKSPLIFERYGVKYSGSCNKEMKDYESIVRKYTKFNFQK